MDHKQQWTLVLTSIIGMMFVLIVLACSTAFEGSDRVLIGQVSDFPESEPPYPVGEPEGFLIHQDDHFIFLSSRSPHEVFQHCKIVWDSERDRFMEPFGGSFFGLNGRYLDGPSPSGMTKYELIFREGEIWVNLSEIISGTPLE